MFWDTNYECVQMRYHLALTLFNNVEYNKPWRYDGFMFNSLILFKLHKDNDENYLLEEYDDYSVLNHHS